MRLAYVMTSKTRTQARMLDMRTKAVLITAILLKYKTDGDVKYSLKMGLS